MWLDALTTNVDRTARNPNLLLWHGRLWLIDHGAALYLQHGGLDPERHAERPFPPIAEHVLLARAGSIAEADRRLRSRAATCDRGAIEAAVALVPPTRGSPAPTPRLRRVSAPPAGRRWFRRAKPSGP